MTLAQIEVEFGSLEAAMEEAVYDGQCVAVCTKPNHECDCETDPDGRCPCGCQSILLHFGIM